MLRFYYVVSFSFGRTPLNDAVENCRFEVIPILLNCGATLGARNDETTAEAMCKAASRGNIQILKAYKLAGASFNQRDIAGRSPLHLVTIKTW